jgi:hypothetical protein
MLELVEQRADLNAWRRPREAPPDRKLLNFELLPNRINCNSATFSIYRAKIPGGWLLAMRPNDNLTFVPDPLHEWDGGSM